MSWLKQLFSRRRIYGELSEEIREHMEEKIEDLVAGGMSRREASYAARREFGNVMLVEESSRDVWRWPFIEDFLMDFRYGLRTLRKSPGFTGVVILTLALGIGANTAIFTMMNGLMLHTLPVRDPGQLVEILHHYPDEPEPGFNGFSWDAYQIMRDRNHVLSDLIIGSLNVYVVGGQGLESQTVFGGNVGETFFESLGVRPAIGRLIGPQDIKDSSAVAVVSWSFW